MESGADPGFKKKGAQHTVFFGPPAASKVAQVPKKLMSGGGRLRHYFFFFGAPPASRVAQVPIGARGGGGGGDPTHFCVPTHFFFFFLCFKRGAHVQKGGGGANVEKGFKGGGGHGPGVPPLNPPLSGISNFQT